MDTIIYIHIYIHIIIIYIVYSIYIIYNDKLSKSLVFCFADAFCLLYLIIHSSDLTIKVLRSGGILDSRIVAMHARTWFDADRLIR